MKILYLRESNKQAEDIGEVLKKLGHKVTIIEDFDVDKILEKSKDVDMFFFTRGMVVTGTPADFQFTLHRLQTLLSKMRCKKVFWFTDNIIWLAEEWADGIIPFVDYGFLNDDTWLRRHGYDYIFPLHMGAASTKIGKYRKEYEGDVAFVGKVYGPRVTLIESLKKTYGDRFKIYSDVSKEDFADLCASVKVLISPRFPSDEFYWSGMIYNTLGVEGFMLHPRLYGLEFEDKKHYIGYSSWDEFIDAINYFTDMKHEEERKKIAKAGRIEVIKQYTLKHRLKELISRL